MTSEESSVAVEHDSIDYRQAFCESCGRALGAGYLCDECDGVEGWE